MRGPVIVALAAMASIAGGAPAASAQDDRMLRPPAQPEAIIYRDAGYRGPAVNVSRAEANLGLAWPVNAIRVKSGRWQLCEQPNYRGTCRMVERDSMRLGGPVRGILVQSMRPIGFVDPVVPGDNRSLRGMAAQFYPAPATNGRRVLACANGGSTSSCAATTADRFCVTQGWRVSNREALQTVNGRVYLADVLCTNTGR